jgi:hypothetical protein
MTREQYLQIAKCVRRRGTRKQKEALKNGLMGTGGWDYVVNKRDGEFRRYQAKIACMATEISLLKSRLRRNNLPDTFDFDYCGDKNCMRCHAEIIFRESGKEE